MDQSIFVRYIDDLQKHLFEDSTVDKILCSHHNSHRGSRFISMYLLKDRNTFKGLFDKKSEYQLEAIFNKVLTTLFRHEKHVDLKKHFIGLLGVSLEMITAEASLQEVRELDKDLSSFELWRMKRVEVGGDDQ